MADGPTFKQIRGQIKRKATLFTEYLDNLDENSLTDLDILQIENRIRKFEPCLDEFDQAQLELLKVYPNDPSNEQEEADFQQKYYLILSKAQNIVARFKQTISISTAPIGAQAQQGTSSSQPQIVISSSLPKLGVHKFTGKYEDWQGWKEAFIAVIDSDQGADDRQKFLYLRDSLEPHVLEVIKSIEIKPSNYRLAWNTLVERFENKPLIIHNHVKSIIEYPALQKESCRDLRSLYDSLKGNLRSLESLGENIDSWDRMVLYLVAKKLDSRTRRDWELFKYDQELPSMKDFDKFVTQKCSMLERVEMHRQSETFETKKYTNYKHKGVSLVTREVRCEFCDGNHGIQNCTNFLMLSTPQRISKIKDKKLCLNCFSNSHLSISCKAPKCGKCLKAHNLLLHLEFRNNLRPETAANVGVVSENLHKQKQSKVGGFAETTEQTVLENSSRDISADGDSASLNIISVSAEKRDNDNENMSQINKTEIDSINATTTAVLKVSSRTESNSPGADSKKLNQVLLSTAIVNVIFNGKLIPARALLDSGSTSNFIREEFCKRVGIKMYKTNHVVNGLGKNAINLNKQTNIIIQSTQDITFRTEINCLVIPRITDSLPRVSIEGLLTIPDHCELADPTFNISSEVDLLLGSHIFWSVIRAGQISLGKNMPILQQSKLGWVVAGRLFYGRGEAVCDASVSCLSINTRLENQVAKFWELEEISPNFKPASDADKFCEINFEATTQRKSDGRFSVTIPFKESLSKLGESRDIALKRFHALENKLYKNEDLRRDYVDFMQEYESLGHMTELEQTDENLNSGYFLPHHAVIKDTSITTKCRVVFDASAKTDQGSGPSLNQVQFTGPALQNDIFSILVNFRQFKYVMCADISKMFRQIWINENQRQFQKIFWRSRPDQPIKLYELNTVTYGYASSPYLAVRCIMQLARDFEKKFPEASEQIASKFYIDDLITGQNCAKKLVQIQNQIYDILLSAGFELRKWLCNDPSLLTQFKLNDKTPASVLQIGEDENNKTLGVFWNASNDTIQYSICDFNDNITGISKRKILSVICQIYDPLGLLGPVIIVAKLIMQELWRLKGSWDENVPDGVFQKWLDFQINLKLMNKLKIPRHACLSDYVNIELHGFADASTKAYGACIYLRCVDEERRVSVRLLCSKTRVAPINPISLPRLELSACVLLANLVKKVKNAIKINFDNQFYWTDSSVTLAWLRGDITKYKTFVANRVSEIYSLTNKTDWYHIKTDLNPADLASRGCTPQFLLESKLWFEGPDWLKLPGTAWPWSQVNFDLSFKDIDIPEVKTVSTCLVLDIKVSEFLPIIDRFSDLNKLISVFGWVLRPLQTLSVFRQNKKYLELPKHLRPERVKLPNVLQPQEFENALLFLIKITQIKYFETEYKLLSENKPVQRDSKILKLNPFLHQSLIRVGGRLRNSSLNFDKKHQIILPKGDKLTELIIRHEHERLLHCGTQQLIYSLREKFWPISVKNTCKKVIKNCISCFKVQPTGVDYLMGELPPERVQASSPFSNVGIDYGGPYLIRDRHLTRSPKLIKVYLCLFICMSTKACHLEAVTELTTAAFLNTLKRFMGRRGKPANIFSDNGKNFVGAAAELESLYKFLDNQTENIERYLAKDRIKWHFIPARSPSFGGLWEAAIKRAKFHLTRVIQGHTNSLTYEHFSTLLVEIEGILNSRPLSPLSNDPLDLNPLTPAHFLIGRSLSALPQTNLLEIPENRLGQYNRLTAMVQQFWVRWTKEYLSELQVRQKWNQRGENIKVGALVLLVDENSSPYSWKLGRIIQVFPGSDGVVRVVEIKTQSGVVRRSVQKVRPLPIAG